MQRGRKPTPNVVKLMNGSRRANHNASDDIEGSTPASSLFVPPDYLTEDQKAIWRNAIDHAPRGLLRTIDERLLVIWVIACDMHQKAAKEIEANGLTVTSPRQGVLMQSPHVSIMNRQAEIMMRAASELGFPPTARARTTGAAPEKKDLNRFANNARKKAR